MTFLKELFLAVRCFGQAIPYINRNRLWKYFVIPALANLVLFLSVGYVAFIYSGEFIDYVTDLVGIETEATIQSVLQFILALLIRGLALLVYLKVYRYLALIILAPILALMAEKLQEITTGSSQPFSLKQVMSDAIRGAGIALKNLVRELTLTGAILLIALVAAPVAILAPFVIFTVESYFYGFSMIDYFNELSRLNARESRDMIWSHRGLAVGNGMMFNLLLFIPVIGVLTAPMIALTAAHLSLQKLNQSI